MGHHDGRQRGLRIVVQGAYFLTSHVAPASELETASMIHSMCWPGAAITRGMCTKSTIDAIIAASSVAASRAWMPLTSATPAAKCPTPVAQAQKTWDGGIQRGTIEAVKSM